MSVNLKQCELLAPAGGFSQLKAAIRFGANAVYLAGNKFGMRARANNFSLQEIGEAVKLAHSAGVSVHVTANTIMHEADLRELPAFFEALESFGVDAVIVGDLGALALAVKYAPHVARHASTQASITNALAAKTWYDLGASRVVLAREMSLESIAALAKGVPVGLELEAFVHGAMCMAYSGRCMLSAAMCGRSANKGFCAQPCRWSYALVEQNRPNLAFPIEEDEFGTYVMNAYDLCMIEHLQELANAGVTSFKLEGRNKRAFYVASVVHAYRAVMDGETPESVMPDLYAISHRPYGTGFYFGQPKQRLDKDGYDKECIHVATVTKCDAKAEVADANVNGVDARNNSSTSSTNGYTVTVTCHNRFAENQMLELLEPHAPIKQIVIRNIMWHPAQEGESCVVPVPVEVANRAMETYTFEHCEPIEAGSFLRAQASETVGAAQNNATK